MFFFLPKYHSDPEYGTLAQEAVVHELQRRKVFLLPYSTCRCVGELTVGITSQRFQRMLQQPHHSSKAKRKRVDYKTVKASTEIRNPKKKKKL